MIGKPKRPAHERQVLTLFSVTSRGYLTFRFASAAIALLAIAAALALRSSARELDSFSKSDFDSSFLSVLQEAHSVQDNSAQNTNLNLGESTQREIKGGERQIFAIALAKHQYAQITFEWQGTDLEVEVLNPNEITLPASNVQVRGARSLPVTFIADAEGTYKLVVRTTNNLKISGSYGVKLEIARPSTLADRKRVEATTLLAEAAQNPFSENAKQKLQQALEIWSEVGESHGADAYALQLRGNLSIRSSHVSAPNNSNAQQFQEGEKYYEQAIGILRNSDPRQLAYTLLDIGSDYGRLVSPAKALPYYHLALDGFRHLTDRRGESEALYSIGLAEARIGHMREALKWYEQALVIQRARHDLPGMVSTLNAMGGAHNVLADQEQALSRYQEAEPIWQELGDRYRAAIVNMNIGVVYDDWGNWQTAKDRYRQSLEVYKSLLAKPYPDSCREAIVPNETSICNSIANVLDNIGELHSSLGEPQSALEGFRESLEIRHALKQPRGLGATLSRIAYAYILDNKPADALKYAEQALPFSRTANDLRKASSILTFMGMAYAAQHRPDKALEQYHQALRIQEKTEERRGLAITLDQMGRAYAADKQITKAFDAYNGALAIWQEIKDEEWETRTLYNLATAERERGDLGRADELIAKALQIIESRRILLSSQKLRTSYFANKDEMYALAVDLKMQQRETKGEYLTAGLETSERQRARVLVDLIGEAEARHEINSLQSSSDTVLRELIRQKQTAQNKLNIKGHSLAAVPKEERDVRGAAIAYAIQELTDELDQLERQIKARSPRYAELTKPRPLNLEEIQQQLDADTLLLEYSLGEKRSYVWAVTPNSIHGFELPARAKIEEVAHRFRAALTARNQQIENEPGQARNDRVRRTDSESVESAKELTKLVLEPVAPLLGEKRLVIVADGALQLVPFAMLPAPANARVQETTPKLGTPKNKVLTDQSRWLVDDHEIVSLPSASVLAVQRRELANRKPAPLAIAVLADPVFDEIDMQRELKLRSTQKAVDGRKQPATVTSGKSPTTSSNASDLSRALRDVGIERIAWLPFSRLEAEAILKLAPRGQRLEAFGFDASLATATSPQMANYRVIHFATHGMVNFEHPELSGIVLSTIDEKGHPQEGFLRLHEIYNLNLPAELVVLSACETGVGKQIKGEGLIALTRGFMYAGAPRVVASLWKVSDAATADLMREFYTQMFIHKQKPAAALRKAQLKLSRDKRWGRSPYFWAGFVLQGEWR